MKKITQKLALMLMLVLTGASFAQKNIAFIGQAGTYNDNLSSNNLEFLPEGDTAAGIWFIEDFGVNTPNVTVNYLSFEDVAAGANLSIYDAIWIQYDPETWTGRLKDFPRSAPEGDGTIHSMLKETGFDWGRNGAIDDPLENAFIDAIKTYYQAGGNMLLGNFAGAGIEPFGVINPTLSSPWEYKPNQDFGDVSPNPDNTPNPWGNWWNGAVGSPLISGITTSTNADCSNAPYIEMLSSGTQKKNRVLQYNLDFGRIANDNPGATLATKRGILEDLLQAKILLQNCGANEIQGIQFNPTGFNTGKGTVISYGAGTYDWYVGTNGNNNNVKKLTKNTLLYLAGVTAYNYYADADVDGYGAGAIVVSYSTTAPTGYSVNNTDCNDTDATVHPGVLEVFDGIDNDCDGNVDNITALSFCAGATVATAAGTTDLALFTKATGGLALAPTIPLKSAVYYATLNGSSRTALTVTVNPLPTTPSPLVLTNGLEVIKKAGNFIGTATALTLTATATGTIPTDHYNWTLPSDAHQASGGSTGVITVDFTNVVAGNTSLDFFVSSVSANGCVSKTAKKLTVTRSEPGKPKGLTITDAELPAVLKIKKLDAYTGALNTRTLTLTATPETKAGSQATSYKWVLPAAATTTATPVIGESNTYTSTLPTIDVNLANVTTETIFLFKAFGVNGNGTSLLSKDLTCTSAAPKTPGAITTPSLGKPTYNTTCNTVVTVQVPSVLGVTYAWTVDGGATISSGQGSNSIVINTASASATLSISVTASNGTGTSLAKVLLLKATSGCKIAAEQVIAADEFNVIAYPNPSSSEFTIDVQSSSKGTTNVQVYDMVGRLIENRQVNSNSIQIGSRLASGVYNVIVNQGSKVKTLRVIKK